MAEEPATPPGPDDVAENVPEDIRPKGSPVQWAMRGGLAVFVSVVALWWATRATDVDRLTAQLADTEWLIFGLYVGANILFQLVRVVRWGLLILPVAPVSLRAIASAGLVGIPAAAFLPLRLGEFVRPVMIARAGVPFGAGMASVVVERVADGLFNVGLFFFLLAILPEDAPLPDEVRYVGKVAFAVFGGACAFLVLAAFARQTADRIIRRILEPVSEGLTERILGLLHTFLDGLAPLAKPSRLFTFLFLTGVYWGINGAVTTLLARSYGLDVPFIAGPFAITCVVFAIMVPAGPAFVGTLQVGMQLGLAPFSVSPSDALVVAISAHVGTLVVLTLSMGVGFIVAERRSAVRKVVSGLE